jgi:hypothetical protein
MLKMFSSNLLSPGTTVIWRLIRPGDDVLTDATAALDEIVKQGDLSQSPDCQTPTLRQAEGDSSQDTVN